MPPDVRPLPELVVAGEVAMVTTITVDGRLTSRPLTIAGVDDHDVRFLIDAHAAWASEIGGLPNVNVAVGACGSDDWVSLTGRATIAQDPVEIDHLWGPAAEAFFTDRHDPRLSVLRVRVEGGEYWSSPGGGPVGRLLSRVGATPAAGSGGAGPLAV